MNPRRNERITFWVFAAASFIAVVALCGCSLFPDKTAEKIATSGNARMYYEARYEEKCVEVKGPPSCHEAKTALDHWKKWLGLTVASHKLGGKIPLHLAQLKADEAATKKAVP